MSSIVDVFVRKRMALRYLFFVAVYIVNDNVEVKGVNSDSYLLLQEDIAVRWVISRPEVRNV